MGLKEKLPENWLLDSSNFTEFLSFLQQEIRVREMARGVWDSPQPSNAISLSARRVIHTGSPELPRESGALTLDVFGRRLGQTEGLHCIEEPERWGAAPCSRAGTQSLHVRHGSDSRGGSLKPNQNLGENPSRKPRVELSNRNQSWMGV